MTSLTFAIVILLLIIVVAIHLIIQRIKLNKEEALLRAQDEKLKEIMRRQKDNEKYKDFTDGHMYK